MGGSQNIHLGLEYFTATELLTKAKQKNSHLMCWFTDAREPLDTKLYI